MTKFCRIILSKINSWGGLWTFLSLIAGVAIGVFGTLTTQSVIYKNTLVDRSIQQVNSSDQQVNSPDIGGDIGGDVISMHGTGNNVFKNIYNDKHPSISFDEYSEAIAMRDFATIEAYELNAKNKNIQHAFAFSKKMADGRFVANAFFENIAGDTQALDWLKKSFDNGFDINSKIHLGNEISTSLFWLAVHSQSIETAVFLLKNGASVHSWHQIEGERSQYARMAYPVEYILNSRHLSMYKKKLLIIELIRNGASVTNRRDTREKLASMGIEINLKNNICEQPCNYGNVICDIVEKFKNSYDLKYYRTSGAVFFPESFFIGVDGDIYIKNREYSQLFQEHNFPHTQSIIKINPDKNKTILYGYDYRACGRYDDCWQSTYIETDFDTGEIHKEVEKKRICK